MNALFSSGLDPVVASLCSVLKLSELLAIQRSLGAVARSRVKRDVASAVAEYIEYLWLCAKSVYANIADAEAAILKQLPPLFVVKFLTFPPASLSTSPPLSPSLDIPERLQRKIDAISAHDAAWPQVPTQTLSNVTPTT